ncbi:MAG: serine/threonine protein kinase [Planctomycetes bacterium]|nr:serine/threonine protein kinase [Planctomycetota bacterium]
MNHQPPLAVLLLTSVAIAQPAAAPDDWRAFRGTTGTATHPGPAPVEWSDGTGIRWKRKLPGPGASSPVIVGDDVFVTCWSGYALDPKKPGDPQQLRRQLIRLNRRTGKVVWTADCRPVKTEDTFDGRMSTHGYASSTPVSDGECLFVFFGKSGVFAYDLDGKQKWWADVGTGSSQWKTGSGSSPALWGNLLFVNASDESHSLRALDKRTGKEVWKRETEAMDQAYATPVVVGQGDGAVLVLAILGRIWGLDPKTGEMRWSVKTVTGGALVPTIISDGSVIYSFGGRTRLQSYAVRLGGEGDVSKTHVAWSSRYGAYVCTPVLHQGHLYWVDRRGAAFCAEAKTGKLVYRERLEGSFYASPVLIGDKIYAVSRDNGTFILAARPKFELLKHNQLKKDESLFDGTPAVSGGLLYLRSRQFLYCIGG